MRIITGEEADQLILVGEVDFRLRINDFSHTVESSQNGRAYTLYGTNLLLGFAGDDGRFFLSRAISLDIPGETFDEYFKRTVTKKEPKSVPPENRSNSGGKTLVEVFAAEEALKMKVK